MIINLYLKNKRQKKIIKYYIKNPHKFIGVNNELINFIRKKDKNKSINLLRDNLRNSWNDELPKFKNILWNIFFQNQVKINQKELKNLKNFFLKKIISNNFILNYPPSEIKKNLVQDIDTFFENFIVSYLNEKYKKLLNKY